MVECSLPISRKELEKPPWIADGVTIPANPRALTRPELWHWFSVPGDHRSCPIYKQKLRLTRYTENSGQAFVGNKCRDRYRDRQTRRMSMWSLRWQTAMLENTHFTFFHISNNVTFYVFLKWRVKKSQRVFSKSSVLNHLKWVHILRSVISVIHQGLSLIFSNDWLLKLKIWLGVEANIIT